MVTVRMSDFLSVLVPIQSLLMNCSQAPAGTLRGGPRIVRGCGQEHTNPTYPLGLLRSRHAAALPSPAMKCRRFIE